MKRNIGLFIFPNAEVLYIGGPFEVFSVASELTDYSLFDVFTIAKSHEPILAVNGLSINAKYAFDNHPKIDILIVVGGSGSRELLEDTETLKWIEKIHQYTEITMSICSGSRLLGKLGAASQTAILYAPSGLRTYEHYCTDGHSDETQTVLQGRQDLYFGRDFSWN